jgi:PAS domain S-box-containing protein
VDRPPELDLRRYLESQREITAQLLAGDSLASVADRFLATVAELLDWEAGAIWQVEPKAKPLRFVSGWSRAPFDADPLWRLSRELSFEPGSGVPGRAWESGRIVSVSDPQGERGLRRRTCARDLGLATSLAIPVPIGDPAKVLAVAEFHSTAAVSLADEVIEVLGGFADQLATFLREVSDRALAERARNHLAEVVKGTQDAVLSKDLEGYVTSWNPAAERLYGYTAEEAVGRHVSFLIPPDHKNEEREILDRVCRGERLETYETERIRKDGSRVDVSLTVSRIESPPLGIVGASVVARDITAQRRRQRAQEFLVAVSRSLDASLDPYETARTIVSTAVPELAELCVIDFVRGDGTIGDSIVAAGDPRDAAELERIRKSSPLDPAGGHPVAQVLREGRPMVWRDLKAPGIVQQVAQSEDHLRLMDKAGYNSAAVVGLTARGRTLGALSFLHARGDLRYDSSDLEFLSELGDRAAMALDNARLYRERDQIANSLQRGLRPPQPANVQGLEFSVVFEAAGDGIEIGGDLYDVLPTDDGCWILIGDVAGKGSTAAGVSVALRHSVRGLTREVDEPVEVLRRINELLLEGTTLNDFATAMLIRLRRNGGDWDMTLAAAGHPPAIHVRGDGPRQLGGGTVLGAWSDAPVESHEGRVASGETLVLCTDGWLEAGPSDGHREPGNLAELAGALADVELSELTARLCRDALERGEGELRDDMVVLAVRPNPGAKAA